HQAPGRAHGQAQRKEGGHRCTAGRCDDLFGRQEGRAEGPAARPGVRRQRARGARKRMADQAGRARARPGLMLKYGSVVFLMLAGWAALTPQPMSWLFIGAVAAFELWLFGRMRSLARWPVSVEEPPYRFTAEEARFVERYRFYFTYP